MTRASQSIFSALNVATSVCPPPRCHKSAGTRQPPGDDEMRPSGAALNHPNPLLEPGLNWCSPWFALPSDLHLSNAFLNPLLMGAVGGVLAVYSQLPWVA